MLHWEGNTDNAEERDSHCKIRVLEQLKMVLLEELVLNKAREFIVHYRRAVIDNDEGKKTRRA